MAPISQSANRAIGKIDYDSGSKLRMITCEKLMQARLKSFIQGGEDLQVATTLGIQDCTLIANLAGSKEISRQ